MRSFLEHVLDKLQDIALERFLDQFPVLKSILISLFLSFVLASLLAAGWSAIRWRIVGVQVIAVWLAGVVLQMVAGYSRWILLFSFGTLALVGIIAALLPQRRFASTYVTIIVTILWGAIPHYFAGDEGFLESWSHTLWSTIIAVLPTYLVFIATRAIVLRKPAAVAEASQT